MGFFDKLKQGLKKTKENFVGKIDKMLAGFGVVSAQPPSSFHVLC